MPASSSRSRAAITSTSRRRSIHSAVPTMPSPISSAGRYRRRRRAAACTDSLRAPRAQRPTGPRGHPGRIGTSGPPRRRASSRSRATPRALTGRGECSRRVTSSIRSSAAAMLGTFSGTRDDSGASAIAGVVDRATQRAGDGFAFVGRCQPRRMHGECTAGGSGHAHRQHPIKLAGQQAGHQARADGGAWCLVAPYRVLYLGVERNPSEILFSLMVPCPLSIRTSFQFCDHQIRYTGHA